MCTKLDLEHCHQRFHVGRILQAAKRGAESEAMMQTVHSDCLSLLLAPKSPHQKTHGWYSDTDEQVDKQSAPHLSQEREMITGDIYHSDVSAQF